MAHNIGKAEKIKVVALDFDGVITSLDIDWKALIRIASALVGYDVKSLILFYENNFGTPIFQKVSLEMEKIELEAIKKASVLPYVKEALRKLAEKQVDVYIVSMQSYCVVKEFLDQHGLASNFKKIITRENCPGKKAQVECLVKATRLLPSQVLLVDDSRRNISLCREIGVACFLFQDMQNRKDPKKIWDNLLELLK